ncbi:MAG: DUF721 domain-containing protein [Pseudomonadota bacterium]
MSRKPDRKTSTFGFKRTSSLLQKRIRAAAESRGFAVSRVVTHWAEIVGEDVAGVCRPVDVGYNRGGFGATLTLLTTGARAPELEMQKERLRQKVNATYGYNAISRIRITQSAATGFADGAAVFNPRKPDRPVDQSPKISAQAAADAEDIQDTDLRHAIERLSQNLLQKNRN